MGFDGWGTPATKLDNESQERRLRERRTQRRFRFLDKRTGFDRRALGEQSRGEGFLERGLVYLRNSPAAFGVLLLALNLLNLTDYACTIVALRSGVQEGNPFMAELFSQGPVSAGRAKIALVVLVSALLWRFRTFRKAILAAVFILAGFLAIFAYHAVGLALVLVFRS